MRKSYLIIFVCALLCLPSSLLAQFQGGMGDGNGIGNLLQTNFQGQLMGTQALFSGGNGDGHDQSFNYQSLGGNQADVLYYGGAGDGANLNSSNLSLEGANLDLMFEGGVGDGQDFSLTQRSLNGQDLSVLYYGGAGDGHDRSLIQSIIDGSSTEVLFSGGMGDGHDAILEKSSLSGDNLAVMFRGGIGDGHDVSQYNGIVPFPVVLLSFDAFPEERFVLLQWVTESEQNSDYFTIEKTKDGQLFLPIINVAAAGNSDEVLPYETIDHNPFEGQSFYRLKAVDIDGAFMYSHLVEVNFSNNVMWNFNLYPNPNSGNLINLEIESLSLGDELQIEVLDMKGRLLYQESKLIALDGLYQTQIEIGSRLAEGSYLVRILNGAKGQQAKILMVH